MEYTMRPVSLEQNSAIPSAIVYASFWRRFFAFILDVSIAFFLFFIVTKLLLALKLDLFPDNPSLLIALVGGLLVILTFWLYFALFESSYLEATLGKIALGIRVRDINGVAIDFKHASGRFFATFFSFMTLCVGFIMCAFTQRRQALHDIVASTIVIRNPVEAEPAVFTTTLKPRTGSVDDVIASFGDRISPVTMLVSDQSQLIGAGFWKRFVAWIIDFFVVDILLTPLRLLMGLNWLTPHMKIRDYFDFSSREARVRIIYSWISIVVNWLYASTMESSSKQGTVGKMALAIKITDLNGDRISFGRATGRHFAKIISTITLFVGFMMAGWTKKKQALHDIIAETLVIRNSN